MHGGNLRNSSTHPPAMTPNSQANFPTSTTGNRIPTQMAWTRYRKRLYGLDSGTCTRRGVSQDALPVFVAELHIAVLEGVDSNVGNYNHAMHCGIMTLRAGVEMNYVNMMIRIKFPNCRWKWVDSRKNTALIEVWGSFRLVIWDLLEVTACLPCRLWKALLC